MRDKHDRPSAVVRVPLAASILSTALFIGGDEPATGREHPQPYVDPPRNTVATTQAMLQQGLPRLANDEKLLSLVHDSIVKTEDLSVRPILEAVLRHTSSDADPQAPSRADQLVSDYALLVGPRNGNNFDWAQNIIREWVKLGGTLTPELKSFQEAGLTGTMNLYLRADSLTVVRSSSPWKMTAKVRVMDESGKVQVYAPKIKGSERAERTEYQVDTYDLLLPMNCQRAVVAYCISNPENQRIFSGAQVFVPSSADAATNPAWVVEVSLASQVHAAVRMARDDLKPAQIDPKSWLGRAFPQDVKLIDPDVNGVNVLPAGRFAVEPGKVNLVALGDLDTCAACIYEARLLSEIKQELGADVHIVNLSVSGKLGKYPGLYKQLFGRLDPVTGKQLGQGGIPINLVVNRQGKIVQIMHGLHKDDPKGALKTAIQAALSQDKAP